MARMQIHEVTLNATPEEIWKLITEAEGITRWFAPEARVEAGEGGKVYLSWGEGMGGECPIHLWEPNKAFGWTEGVKTVEFHLEGEGGKTTLRVVQSGFGEGASFEDEYNAVNGGWRSFFAALQFGVLHHSHEACEQVANMRMVKGPQGQVIERLSSTLRFDPPLDQIRKGEKFKAILGDLGAVTGTRLEPDKPGYYLLTLDEWNKSAVGLFVEVFGGAMAVTQQWWLFGYASGRAAQVRTALTQWQDEIGKEQAQ